MVGFKLKVEVRVVRVMVGLVIHYLDSLFKSFYEILTFKY